MYTLITQNAPVKASYMDLARGTRDLLVIHNVQCHSRHSCHIDQFDENWNTPVLDNFRTLLTITKL